MRLSLGLFSFCLLVQGCAHQVKLTNAKAVSETHSFLEPGQELKSLGFVSGELCLKNNQAFLGSNFSSLIASVQRNSRADIITDAAFYRKKNCLILRGVGQKIIK